MRLDEIDVEIAQVYDKHSATMNDANDRMFAREADARNAKTGFDGATASVAITQEEIASLRQRLAEKLIQLQRFQDAQGVARAAHESALQALAVETAARDKRLDEPRKHLAALQKDRDSVTYRLEQHLARTPHKSLFVGSKS